LQQYINLSLTQITRRQVDGYKAEQLFPHCKLEVENESADGRALRSKVILKDAEEPYNYFYLKFGCTRRGASPILLLF